MPRVLVDTNILVAATQRSHSEYEVAINSQMVLTDAGDNLCVVDQNLIEFRVVAPDRFLPMD